MSGEGHILTPLSGVCNTVSKGKAEIPVVTAHSMWPALSHTKRESWPKFQANPLAGGRAMSHDLQQLLWAFMDHS